MMRSIGIGTFGVLLCVLLLGQGSLAPKQGTGTLTGNIVPDLDYPPGLPVRLCSTERVLQTKSQRRGMFALTDVPAGTYQLVAGHPGWSVFAVKNVEIMDQRTESIMINRGDPQPGDSICFRDTETACGPTYFIVGYSERSSEEATNLFGQVVNAGAKRQKGVANARIHIFRAGETNPIAVAVADKQGWFQISLQPGVYNLVASHKDLQDVKIPDFLVPRENETDIRIATNSRGAIALCQ